MKKLFLLFLLVIPVASNTLSDQIDHERAKVPKKNHVCDGYKNRPCERFFNFLITQIEQAKTEKELSYFEKIARKHKKTMWVCYVENTGGWYPCMTPAVNNFYERYTERLDEAVEKAKQAIAQTNNS